MSSDYGFSLTTFSPTGKLVQIEYALNAINKEGRPALGLKVNDGIIICSEKKITSITIDEESVVKVEKIADHIGCVYSGMPADFRVLFSKIKQIAITYESTYNEPIPVLHLTKQVADIMQEFTQSGGVRPFGCALLIAGYDENGYRLYQIDPSGAYFSWKATSLGKDSKNAKVFLERRYRENLSIEDAIHVALLTMRELCEGSINDDNIEIGVLCNEKFKKLHKTEVKDYLRNAD